jgi:hypothetical protein
VFLCEKAVEIAYFSRHAIAGRIMSNTIIKRFLNAVIDHRGRAVAQAVSLWLPTAAARVRFRASMWGFVVDKAALGQVFSEYFRFPCQSSFHQFLHHHNQSGLSH